MSTVWDIIEETNKRTLEDISRLTSSHDCRYINIYIDRQIYRLMDSQIDMKTDRQIVRLIGRLIDRQMDRQINRL